MLDGFSMGEPPIEPLICRYDTLTDASKRLDEALSKLR